MLPAGRLYAVRSLIYAWFALPLARNNCAVRHLAANDGTTESLTKRILKAVPRCEEPHSEKLSSTAV